VTAADTWSGYPQNGRGNSMARLTAVSVQNAKPGPVRREIADGGCTGLYLLIQPKSGRKSWCVRFRHAGKPCKLTLDASTLADARKAATAALAEVAAGRDPREAKKTAEAKAQLAKADTVRSVCEAWLAREGKKLRTVDQRRSVFERWVYPQFGGRPIASVTRGEIVHLLDKIEDQCGPRAADHSLAAVRRVFNWYAPRSDDFRSPIVRGMGRAAPAAERARSRTLTDGEIRRVWAAAGDAGAFGVGVKLLLSVGARLSEIFKMSRSELEGTDWVLPAARNKVKQELVRPLSRAALDLLEGLPIIDGCEFYFALHGRRPFNDFARAKKLLDAASGVAGWRLHDLRRTSRSLMSRAGVNPDHAERVLGHVIGGVRQTYDRHEFYNEKKQALEALAGLIARIVNPPTDNVVALHG
jgi:integrase